MMAFLIISSLLIPLLLSVSANTNESDLDCIPSIMVPRNVVWKARVTDVLRINCTVDTESHCWKNANVSWCKIDDKNECKHLKHSSHIITEWSSVSKNKRMLFLIFRKISMQDAGLYRCRINSPTPTVSHSINVTVTDYKVVSTENVTADTPAVMLPGTDDTHTPLLGEKWSYVMYFSVFVVALILAVPLIMSRGLKKFPKDEVTVTTVIYEEAEKSRVQD